MADKVLNIIRETLLHDNEIEEFAFHFEHGAARFTIAQPRDDGGWPDYELELLFSGIREFRLSSVPTELSWKNGLLGIECKKCNDAYHAIVSVGSSGHPPVWTLHLVFTDLTYKRESR
jgi:hypothetical protein